MMFLVPDTHTDMTYSVEQSLGIRLILHLDE